MEMTDLGPLRVSRFTLGTWSFAGGGIWGDRQKPESIRIVHRAMAAGVNLIDTAEGYGDGASEEVVGEAVAGRRGSVFLATKFLPQRISRPEDIRTMCEASLSRLKTDYIDLYQQHWPFENPDFSADDVQKVVEDLIAEGKICHFGVCNFGPGDLEAGTLPLISDQVAYSLAFRAIEFEMLPYLKKRGLGVLTYSALMQGLLSGKYLSPEEFPAGRKRTRHFSGANEAARHGEAGYEDLTFTLIRRLKEIAAEAGLTLPACGTGWVLAQPGVSSVIAGAGTEQQLEENLKHFDTALSGDVRTELTRASEELKTAMGPNADLWQGQSRIS